MERMFAIVAATVFTASVSAGEIYHGWDKGNPDLYPEGVQSVEMTGVQPGVGDTVDIYGSFGVGNADLFSGSASSEAYTERSETTDSAIYGGFATGNPDL